MAKPPSQRRVRSAYTVAAVIVVGCLAWPSLVSNPGHLGLLSCLLIVSASAAEVAAARYADRIVLGGWDWCYLLAIFFEGGTAGLAVAWVALIVGWVVLRYRAGSLLLNLASIGAAAVASAAVYDLARGSLGFEVTICVVAVVNLTLQAAIALPLLATQDDIPLSTLLRQQRAVALPLVFQALFAVTIAGVYREYGLAAMAFAFVLIGAFTYMVRLVVVARDRATAHAELSWGVLSGLIRTLEMRDPRAARHCAAVARFSRDIARQAGMSSGDQQLAHTAGLLHDIGKFALSDRVLNGDGLNENDWHGIRRHPEIGEDLLRDISLYGPVGRIVGAHHERWDGRGYPGRLEGDEIPEIARIVAVAEVYDTLTATDTYRTPMTSFEALTTLREAAGRQFDPQFVEALALVLAGQDMSYRHAGDADFDRELDIERRIGEAART